MYTLTVEGMTCGGCARSVEKVVGALKDGAKVIVDFPAGTVTVDDLIDRADAVSAIEKAGFDVVG